MAKEMKAAILNEFGGPEKIKIEKIEIPELKEGDVLIRVKAAGVNPVDAVITKGYYKDKIPHSFPIVLGWDFAGVVEDRGHGARRFAIGDNVYAYVRRPQIKWGSFGQYIVVPDCYLATKPIKLNWNEAAGIPLAGLTAYQALCDAGNLLEGQRVLIIGASGGVGSFAIQLAKSKGAEVIGVASKKNHAYMREMGANHTIDYHEQHIGEAVKNIFPKGIDLILDCTSGESLQKSLISLKKSGKVVSTLSQGENVDPGIDFQFVFVEPDARQLKYLRKLADAGKLRVQVSKTYSLEETAEALKQIETLHTTGKIIIIP